MENIGSVIKKYRKSLNLTQKNVADALGINRVSITQWENGAAMPPINRLPELAALFGVKVSDMIAAAAADEGQRKPIAFKGDVKAANVEMPDLFSMAQNIPVMGTSACSHADGAFQLEPGAVEYVRRPHGLDMVQNVYALYMEGDSMEPKFSSGDLVFINPNRPARIGDAVVVQFFNSDDINTQAITGMLEKRTSNFIEIKKYNPHNLIKIELSKIQAIHRIMTNNELFGL